MKTLPLFYNVIIFSAFFVFTLPVFAQNGIPNNQQVTPGGGIPNNQQVTPDVPLINPLSGNCTSNENCLEDLLMGILDLVIKIGTAVVVLMLVYIGFLFATTSINPENKSKAREALLWTMVGALILLGAQAISIGIQETVKALSTGA
ncbi:MAG: hypothetical protein Q7R54_00790 [bacterium]|nr:hypothetical protein [bacterium]